MKKLIEINQLIKNTWEIYKKNFWNYCGIILVPIGINILALVIILISGVGGFYFWEAGGGFIFILISLIVYFTLIVSHMWGVTALTYAVVSDHKIGIFESFKKSKHLILSFFWIGILTTLAVSLGFILLIIPGIIFAIWFQFSTYILIKENKKGTQALSSSRKLVEGYWWSVFGRIVVSIIIGFLISFVCGIVPFIGSFLAVVLLYPFTIIYSYLIYKNIKEIKQPKVAGIVS
jgi:hypothetical protein